MKAPPPPLPPSVFDQAVDIMSYLAPGGHTQTRTETIGDYGRCLRQGRRGAAAPDVVVCRVGASGGAPAVFSASGVDDGQLFLLFVSGC